VRLISLQKGFGTEQLAEVREQFEVIDFGAELDETTGPFLDTAALMQALDLVISSDTCVPHLAAAMGRPTWVGLSVSPDWRWLLGREDTPWYPTMRLFRQSELGDWDGVFERLNRAVQQLLHESPRQLRLPLPAVTDPLLYACGRYELRQTSDGVWWGDPREVSSFAATGSADPASMGVSFVEEQLLLHQLVNPGEVVVELGARTAARTLALARRVGGDGLVISLAADPEALLHLCTNVALNGLHQVRCVGIGTNLSGEGGPQGPEPTAARRDPGARSHRDPESIGPPWDLDAQSLAACHLLTMDAPGWEGALLQGARETIRRCQPVVYVRRVDPAGRPPLIDSLRSMGYQLYTWQLAPDVQGDSTDLAAAGHLLASSRPLDEEALRLKPLFPS
jgi:hypothetical protein